MGMLPCPGHQYAFLLLEMQDCCFTATDSVHYLQNFCMVLLYYHHRYRTNECWKFFCNMQCRKQETIYLWPKKLGSTVNLDQIQLFLIFFLSQISDWSFYLNRIFVLSSSLVRKRLSLWKCFSLRRKALKSNIKSV